MEQDIRKKINEFFKDFEKEMLAFLEDFKTYQKMNEIKNEEDN